MEKDCGQSPGRVRCTPPSFQNAPVGGGSGTGVLTKGRAERAGVAKAQLESDLGYRKIRLRQKHLGPLHPSRSYITARRQAEGFFEGAGKVERAQAGHFRRLRE